jgi:hypothetical protein
MLASLRLRLRLFAKNNFVENELIKTKQPAINAES